MEGLRSLAMVPPYLLWELRRFAGGFMRRFGVAGAFVLLCAGLAMAGGLLERHERDVLAGLRRDLLAQRAKPLPRVVNTNASDGRVRLAEFDRYLLAYEDIPQAIQDLLDSAAREGLLVAKGEYRAEPDAQGRFLRYRMALPVKGDAAAIHRFMLAALGTQNTLALESVQFKREQIASREVEARIQWLLLTQLPSRALIVATEGGQR